MARCGHYGFQDKLALIRLKHCTGLVQQRKQGVQKARVDVWTGGAQRRLTQRQPEGCQQAQLGQVGSNVGLQRVQAGQGEGHPNFSESHLK